MIVTYLPLLANVVLVLIVADNPDGFVKAMNQYSPSNSLNKHLTRGRLCILKLEEDYHVVTSSPHNDWHIGSLPSVRW